MRKVYFFLFFATALITNAQNVSTEAGYRNILLEDFTGIKCGNCPDGHKYVNKLTLAQPERVFPISVHAGYYATPNAADQPNFLTAEGTEINDYFGINSYPSGMINRKEVGMAGVVQSRSYWISSSRTISREKADVNVWVASTYDKNTRVLTTDVEIYYINNVEASSSSLCVSLLQSGILGPQAGGNMEDEYVHNHVLRAMFTPTWGETIETSTQGTLVKRHFEYTVPEVIGNVDTDPLHFNVVAYVINTKKEVMNVNGCAVKCPGMTLPTRATLEDYKITPTRNYGFNFFECYLVNEGTEPLTSATFKMVFDDDDELEYTWNAANTEAIPSLQRGYVKIPMTLPETYLNGGCDSYKLKLTGLNGKAFAGNTIKGTFGAMIKVDGDIKAIIKTDNFADDNTFRLLDADGNVVEEYGPFTEGKVTTNTLNIHFPKTGIYCIEITDAWGNGILSPRGNMKVYDEAETLLLSNNEIANFGYRAFFNCLQTNAIDNIETNIPTVDNVYNLAGQRIATPAKGVYVINGKKVIIK